MSGQQLQVGHSGILLVLLVAAITLLLVHVAQAHNSHEIDKINLPWCGLETKQCDGGRIAHGDTAEVGQFPYYVQLVRYNFLSNPFNPWEHFCGATIITPRVLLTATHCVDDEDIDDKIRKGNIKGIAGSNYNGYGVDAIIQDLVVYPKTRGNRHDLALLFLKHPIPGVDNPLGGPICSPNYRYRPNTVCLPQPGQEFGDYVSYEGEGLGTPDPTRLQYTTLHTPSPSAMRIDPRLNCKSAGAYCNGTWQIVTHDAREKKHRKHACPGDSGGPLVWIGPHKSGRGNPRATLAAFFMKSSGHICPGVFNISGKVSFYMNWILTEIQKYFDTHE